MRMNRIKNRNKVMIVVVLIVYFCYMLVCYTIYATEDPQVKEDVVKMPGFNWFNLSKTPIVPTQSRAHHDDILHEVFPVDMSYYATYISIIIVPAEGALPPLHKPPSQIVIGLNFTAQLAQASFRQATFETGYAMNRLDEKHRGDAKSVASEMQVMQKDITIPSDVVVKWISDFGVGLGTVIHEILERNPATVNAASTGGTRYIITVRPSSNTITLDFRQSSEGYEPEMISNHIKAGAMMDWVTSILEYFKKTTPDN